MNNSLLSTGALAQKLNLTPRTIRFYEQEKMIEPSVPGRRPLFDEEAVNKLKRILLLKEAGLSLKEIKVVLEQLSGPATTDKKLTLDLREIIGETASLLRQREENIAFLRKCLEKTLSDTDSCIDCTGGNKENCCSGCGKLKMLRSFGVNH